MITSLKCFLCLAFVVASFWAKSQSEYLPGYFINNEGQKTDCEILFLDWSQNPDKISYRNAEGSTSDIMSSNLSEFEIIGVCKYVSRTVEMDISGDDTDDLSYQKAPEWKTITTLLKVLLEGEISLYSSYTEGVPRLFYENGDGISQLIYKRYYTNENKLQIAVNQTYKGQMNVILNCEDSRALINNAGYTPKSISKAFKAYHECTNNNYEAYESKKTSGGLQLSVFSGVSQYAFSAQYPNESYINFSSDSEIGYFFGIEAELLLPVKNNKWSVFISPAVATKSFKTQTDRGPYLNAEKADAEFKLMTLEVPVGIRYYTFLGSESSIRIGVGFAPNISIGESAMFFESNTEFVSIASPWEFGTFFDARLGIGYSFRNISLDASHYVGRGMLSDSHNTAWKTELKTTSLRLTYRVK